VFCHPVAAAPAAVARCVGSAAWMPLARGCIGRGWGDKALPKLCVIQARTCLRLAAPTACCLC
jgi:hypothetical protein